MHGRCQGIRGSAPGVGVGGVEDSLASEEGDLYTGPADQNSELRGFIHADRTPQRADVVLGGR